MPQLRTFIDSGVLLAAFKADGELAENALAVLGDPVRQFVTSDFVRLELLPKPICYGNDAERRFYEGHRHEHSPADLTYPGLCAHRAERTAGSAGFESLFAVH